MSSFTILNGSESKKVGDGILAESLKSVQSSFVIMDSAAVSS